MNKIKVLFKNNKNLKIILIIVMIYSIVDNFNDSFMINGYYSFFQTLTSGFTFSRYIAIIFACMSFMSIDINRKYDTDYFWVGRYKNKEKYLENLLKIIWINNLVIYVIAFLIIFFTLYFQALLNNCLLSANYYYYAMPDYLYLAFAFIKIYLLLQLLITIIVLLWKVFPKKYTFILILITLLDFFLSINTVKVINIEDINFNFSFLISLVDYPSFVMEVCVCSFYCIILMIIIFILNTLFNKKNIDIGG